MGLSENLKRIRTDRNISQRALAEAIGLSDGYISMLETEFKQNPTYEVLNLLAKGLACKVEDLIEESDHPHSTDTA